MDNDKKIRIGCASAFWGDTSTAAEQLVHAGNLDYLVFDFLAEVTMSILAGAKMKNDNLAYATDFVNKLAPLLPEIKKKGIKVISNAGGINLESCRDALIKEAEKENINLNIALIHGDNIIDRQDEFIKKEILDFETGSPLPKNILSMNAYLGAIPIKEALKEAPDIIITGRCVDSALVLGSIMYE